VIVCLGLLAGSYLASGFINASPITREPFGSTQRGRVVVVTPEASGPSSSDEAPAVHVAPAVLPSATHSL
jgi:hypothetical protein